MAKEPSDLPSKSQARRGGSLEESEYSQMSQPQEPQSINFASGVIPIQPRRLQVRLGSLEEQPTTARQPREFPEIDLQQGETRIGYPGKRASRGGAIREPEGDGDAES